MLWCLFICLFVCLFVCPIITQKKDFKAFMVSSYFIYFAFLSKKSLILLKSIDIYFTQIITLHK